MSSVLPIALSGLTAQKQRLDVAANNIANATTAGPVPAAGGPVSAVYKPRDVSLTALTAGGVQAEVTEDLHGYSIIYDPHNTHANTEGLVAVPAVDLTREMVNVLESKLLFRANVSVIKTQAEMQEDLLDTLI